MNSLVYRVQFHDFCCISGSQKYMWKIKGALYFLKNMWGKVDSNCIHQVKKINVFAKFTKNGS